MSGIGKGLGQRKVSLSSLSQNAQRPKLGKDNNRYNFTQEFDKELPPLAQKRKSKATDGKLEFDENPGSRNTLVPRDDFLEAEDN